ncbi:hypothetical protein [Pseudogracilibacillus auburnensis]|uniref:hypothetical protein n=1 Tax=Pseudogracilibacillus auburnensis TaxID=1494959 RepID=UPI001A95A84D|nr:hypothetical protein [Pseudogracilibacillus auburnensis]MBO1005102.1 hypothetical protein [Pseudogracilibacillus auburnensis]
MNNLDQYDVAMQRIRQLHVEAQVIAQYKAINKKSKLSYLKVLVMECNRWLNRIVSKLIPYKKVLLMNKQKQDMRKGR